MEITEINVRRIFKEGPLRAVVSVTFDNEFAIHNIKVINANEKLFLSMHSRKMNDGTYKDTAHPINTEFRRKLENAIFPVYEQAVADTIDDIP